MAGETAAPDIGSRSMTPAPLTAATKTQRMTRTEAKWLASLERNPRSRAKQTMAERERLCLACLKIAARRNKRTAKMMREAANG